MTKTQKIKVLVESIVEQIAESAPPEEVKAFIAYVTENIDVYSHLTYLLRSPFYTDGATFISFCRASVYLRILSGLHGAIIADNEVTKEELDLAAEIVGPGMLDLCKIDDSYSPFYPLTGDELGSFLETAEVATNLRATNQISPSDLLVQFVSLKTKGLGCFEIYRRTLKLAFRIVIESDGIVTAGEKRLNALYEAAIDGTEGINQTLVESDTIREHLFAANNAASQNNCSISFPKEDATELSPESALETAIAQLNELTGLSNVKAEVRRLSNFLQIEAKRKAQGLSTASQSLHFIFTGNPGTGKTTVARIVAKILYGYRVLKHDRLVETDRSSLVGGYVGQTAIKTREVIDRAMDGMLFIDEAYTLSRTGSNDYGQESIDTILKAMEDNRDRLVVVAAGYTNEMAAFLQSNPGIESRFTRFIDFPDYTVKEMCKIFESFAEKNQYKLTPPASANLAIIFNVLYSRRNATFGNGRLVRNVFEKTLGKHSDRLVQLEELTKKDLTTITEFDLPYEVVERKQPFDFDSMRWKAQCPGCQKIYKTQIGFLGKHATCKCGATFKVPYWNPIPSSVDLANTLKDYESITGHLLFD